MSLDYRIEKIKTYAAKESVRCRDYGDAALLEIQAYYISDSSEERGSFFLTEELALSLRDDLNRIFPVAPTFTNMEPGDPVAFVPGVEDEKPEQPGVIVKVYIPKPETPKE